MYGFSLVCINTQKLFMYDFSLVCINTHESTQIMYSFSLVCINLRPASVFEEMKNKIKNLPPASVFFKKCLRI